MCRLYDNNGYRAIHLRWDNEMSESCLFPTRLRTHSKGKSRKIVRARNSWCMSAVKGCLLVMKTVIHMNSHMNTYELTHEIAWVYMQFVQDQAI